MKTIQINRYGGEEQLELLEAPKPSAAQGQVLVRIFATSFNPIDVKLASGTMKEVAPLQFPFTPGADFSGAVDSVGPGVQQFRHGDEVWGNSMGGTYAEYFVVPADKIARKPKSLSHIEATALALVGQTAFQLVDRAGVRQGQTVLVQGGGGAVGSITVQEAHRRGAKVIATAARPSFERLKQYGADELIDYETESFENLVSDVDVVLDTVGGDTLQRSYGAVKQGGVLVTIVQPPSEGEAAKRHITASMVVTDGNFALLQKLAQLADAGEIKPFVGKVYPLAEAAIAWREARSRLSEGKIVLKVAAEPEDASRASAAAS